MSRYSRFKRKKIILRYKVLIVLILLIVMIAGFLAYLGDKYNKDLEPLSNNTATQLFTITPGTNVAQIAINLQKAKLIKNSLALELYVHMHKETASLQAGTYDLSPSQSVAQIVDILSHGKISINLVTIIPGSRIDQVRAAFINAGFSPSSVDSALNPSNYSDIPLLAIKPADVTTLEGLLWPDSFQKDPKTDPTTIIRESLNEMSDHLTSQVQANFASEGLSPYQGLILTSIVNQEVNNSSDQSQVAQVFLNRLKSNMDLGSDVTALYGALLAGQPGNLSYNSPYNTLINKGLPPTPISSVSTSSLYAASHPSGTNWLYFVTGDNGTTYFSTTYSEHQSQTAQYCHKLCSQ